METQRYNWNIKTIKMVIFMSLTLCGLFLFLGFKNFRHSENQSYKSYEIINRWQLPSELREISGMEWLENDQIAAVQDEDGILFIYDLKEKKITERIEFGKPGDYEGLALMNENAYVLESNGNITEIKNYQNPDREITYLQTAFRSNNNTESLEADQVNSRLLIMSKDRDLNSDRIKGIYTLSLKNRKFDSEAVYQVSMDDEVLKQFKDEDLKKTFRPSDLAIHPVTRDIYILDGTKPKLLILDDQGIVKRSISFHEDDFPQPEGITFSPDGTLYISSEGKKNSNGTISELRLQNE
jgi:uncharacterized protein YjiK